MPSGCAMQMASQTANGFSFVFAKRFAFSSAVWKSGQVVTSAVMMKKNRSAIGQRHGERAAEAEDQPGDPEYRCGIHGNSPSVKRGPPPRLIGGMGSVRRP